MSMIGALESRTHFGTVLDGVAAAIIAATLASDAAHEHRRGGAKNRRHRLQERGPRRTARSRDSRRVARDARDARGISRQRPDRRAVRPSRRGPDGKLTQISYGLGVGRRDAEGRAAAARRHLHDEGFLQGSRALDRPALLPLQQPVGDRGSSAARTARSRRSATIRRARRPGATAIATIRARRS